MIPSIDKLVSKTQERKYKQWVWIGTDTDATVDDWKKRFAMMRQSGIDAILPEIYNSKQAFYESKHLPVGEPWLETILPLAKAEGLEVHAWMWSMPCNIPEIVEKHPEWYVVNRLGESAAVKPAYVPIYKFFCPSREGAREFVKKTVTELSQIDGLDGVHFDFIRYPDVILPIALQPRYNIKQTYEFPQYDYCYCDVCRHDFERRTGVDPLKLKDPAGSEAWKQFRYDRITHLVNDIYIPIVHRHKKMATAAVFPNWRDVRQQWFHWNLNGALPMLYNKAYDEGIEWIGYETEEEVRAMRNDAPIYSGINVGSMSPDDIAKAVRVSYEAGSSGLSLFSAQAMTEPLWQSFGEAAKRK
ncbi:MAG: family 10 glycosylhydrolase [Bacteroidetes bacterium]|nr:family 10 glycosylhydrolase [Bacteroidota bacterium]